MTQLQVVQNQALVWLESRRTNLKVSGIGFAGLYHKTVIM